jgi:hypothetical protein
MRHLPATVALIVAVLVASCSGSGSGSPGLASPEQPAPTLPAGVPDSFDEDVPASEIPARALIPPGTEVTDAWLASTSAGESIVVAYTRPGSDPFVQARGFVAWRRTEGATPPWEPVFGIGHDERERILGIQAITGEVTGDDSDDVIVFESTGGVGNCGTWRVIDPGAGAQRWHRSLCDAQVGINADPPGLTLTETVYAPGDSHCCPSALRVSVLEYREPNRFVKVSAETTRL